MGAVFFIWPDLQILLWRNGKKYREHVAGPFIGVVGGRGVGAGFLKLKSASSKRKQFLDGDGDRVRKFKALNSEICLPSPIKKKATCKSEPKLC